MRTALTFALMVAGAWLGLADTDARALDFGVQDPVTSPQDQTPALKGWIIVKYASNVPTADRKVTWVLIHETGEETARAVGANNPHVKKKGDYGIRLSRKGAADKHVDFTLVPKNQVTVVVTK